MVGAAPLPLTGPGGAGAHGSCHTRSRRRPRCSVLVEPGGLAAGAAVAGAAAGGAGEVDDAAEPLEGVVEFAGDDPELVGVAFGDLGEHLQVLVGEQLLVGVARVDGLEDGADGLGLALGLEGGGLGLALGAQDRGLLLALGGEDLGLPD